MTSDEAVAVPIINHILDIYQPDHLERPGQPPSVGNQGSFDLLAAPAILCAGRAEYDYRLL